MKKIVLALVLCTILVGIALLGVGAYTAHWFRQFDGKRFQEALSAANQVETSEPTTADRALVELTALLEEAPPSPLAPILGEDPAPPSQELESVLAGRRAFRSAYASRLASLPPPIGDGPVLQEMHNLRAQRDLAQGACREINALLLVQQTEGVPRLVAGLLHHHQLVERGLANQATLIAKMIGVAMGSLADRCLAATLERDLVPPELAGRLAARYRDAHARDTGLDAAMTSEFERQVRVHEAIEREAGLLASVGHLLYGDPIEQTRALQARWDAAEPVPTKGELEDLHPLVRAGAINWGAAQQRVDEARVRREKLVEALERAAR